MCVRAQYSDKRKNEKCGIGKNTTARGLSWARLMKAELARERARELGFDLIGFAPVGETPHAQAFLGWLAAERHGEMAWLAREPARRMDPRLVLPNTKTVVMVGVSYETLAEPLEVLRQPSRGRIARYAWGADYHDLITPKLRQFGEWIARESRAYVDTGPLLERAWAQACGLGFVGKNTCLIHRKRGSFLFLGAVLVGEDILDGARETDGGDPTRSTSVSGLPTSVKNCGACARCITACPTGALVAPYELDARACISYLTIELKGDIPSHLRPRMGNWVFGCDVCQDVCPYVRRFSAPSAWKEFYPLDVNRAAPKLGDALGWSPGEFARVFKGSAVKRAKWRGFMRNACVAAGNSGDELLAPALGALCQSDDPLVSEHARWALARLV